MDGFASRNHSPRGQYAVIHRNALHENNSHVLQVSVTMRQEVSRRSGRSQTEGPVRLGLSYSLVGGSIG